MSNIAPVTELLSASYYATSGYPHDQWRRLRSEDPVHRVEGWPGEPYWAITRHEDIVGISRLPKRFLNEPKLTLTVDQGLGEGDFPFRTLLNMDPPVHHAYRELVSRRFTPRALRAIRNQVDDIVSDILDELVTDRSDVEVDFVEEIAALLPIWVIAEMLGLPRDDWELLFRWTNQIIGSGDEEYREEGQSPREALEAAQAELFNYFSALTEERRKTPRDDLISVLTHARVDGEPLPVFELMSYYLLLVVAGNETTRNATSGGMLALIENPQELEKARNPAMLKPLVEEILRWTSPVIHFCRTPVEDEEIRGVKVRAGERLVLFYPSANRDDAVFDDPNRFRIDRSPNRHIAFGIGEHFCLGAHVARLELQVIFRHLVERVESAELTGPVQRLRSSVVGGVKHMPVRFKLRPSG